MHIQIETMIQCRRTIMLDRNKKLHKFENGNGFIHNLHTTHTNDTHKHVHTNIIYITNENTKTMRRGKKKKQKKR